MHKVTNVSMIIMLFRLGFVVDWSFFVTFMIWTKMNKSSQNNFNLNKAWKNKRKEHVKIKLKQGLKKHKNEKHNTQLQDKYSNSCCHLILMTLTHTCT